MTALTALLDDAFELAFAGVSTPEAALQLLRRSTQVRDLHEALRSEAVTFSETEVFVQQLMREFLPGIRFAREHALGAIAVAAGRFANEFSERFLTKLSGLRLAELPLAPRVARAILEERNRLTENTRLLRWIAAPLPRDDQIWLANASLVSSSATGALMPQAIRRVA